MASGCILGECPICDELILKMRLILTSTTTWFIEGALIYEITIARRSISYTKKYKRLEKRIKRIGKAE